MPKIATTDRNELKRKLLIQMARPQKNRAVMLLDMADIQTRTFLSEACQELGLVAILVSELPHDFTLQGGFDALITDHESSLDIGFYMSQGVVPIVPQSLFSSLEEFNPMKFEGNAFLFEKTQSFHIFEKLIRFLENIRYP